MSENHQRGGLTRRDFFKIGGTAVGGFMLPMSGGSLLDVIAEILRKVAKSQEQSSGNSRQSQITSRNFDGPYSIKGEITKSAGNKMFSVRTNMENNRFVFEIDTKKETYASGFSTALLISPGNFIINGLEQRLYFAGEEDSLKLKPTEEWNNALCYLADKGVSFAVGKIPFVGEISQIAYSVGKKGADEQELRKFNRWVSNIEEMIKKEYVRAYKRRELKEDVRESLERKGLQKYVKELDFHWLKIPQFQPSFWKGLGEKEVGRNYSINIYGRGKSFLIFNPGVGKGDDISYPEKPLLFLIDIPEIFDAKRRWLEDYLKKGHKFMREADYNDELNFLRNFFRDYTGHLTSIDFEWLLGVFVDVDKKNPEKAKKEIKYLKEKMKNFDKKNY